MTSFCDVFSAWLCLNQNIPPYDTTQLRGVKLIRRIYYFGISLKDIFFYKSVSVIINSVADVKITESAYLSRCINFYHYDYYLMRSIGKHANNTQK